MAKTALVTGASVGIGRALAECFAQGGYHVVLAARNREKLESLKARLESEYGIEARVMPADLADPATPKQLHEALQGEGVAVDCLVNNAGFGAAGDFADANPDALLGMVRVNVQALTELTRLFLPAMLERNAGGILNVGSTLSFVPAPHMAVYGATKAYVLSLSEALAHELRGTGVRVCALCPGATHSEFHHRAGMRAPSPGERLAYMDPAPVARAGYQALHAGRPVVTAGWLNKIMAFAPRFLPRTITAAAAGKIMGARLPGA